MYLILQLRENCKFAAALNGHALQMWVPYSRLAIDCMSLSVVTSDHKVVGTYDTYQTPESESEGKFPTRTLVRLPLP